MREFEDIKIAVAGAGYVGMSIAVLLSQHHDVTLVDVVKDKVDQINAGKCPFDDEFIEGFLSERRLKLRAEVASEESYSDSDIVVVATSTNYDPQRNFFYTHLIEDVIEKVLAVNPGALIVIKSTIPVGYSEHLIEQHKGIKLLFSPEFLREDNALYDNLNPSRIIVGRTTENEEEAHTFARLLQEGAVKQDIPTLFMGLKEAEAVKLFANTYLALRVSYFNELDTYAEMKGLDTKAIIDGVGLDPRIGTHYNNPSFGYGGYCLPKDTKQPLAN